MDPIFFRDVLPTTIDLGEKFVKLFEFAKKKLWGDNEKAFEKLRDVINEILKFYEVTYKEISNFISLDFSNPNNEQPNRKALYDIQGGSLSVRISDAKGHCGRIKRIYEKHLDKWLKKKLTTEEYFEMNKLFMQLSVYDYDMLTAATNLELELQDKSNIILGFLDTKNRIGAVNAQKANRNRFQPIQKRLSSVMEELILLRNEFMAIIGSD